MISINYDPYAMTFSESRKDLRWREIEYFFKQLEWKDIVKVLDVWCGNGRLLAHAKEDWIKFYSYLWIDSSEILLQEAKKIHPEAEFKHLDMVNLEELKWQTFTDVFLIASFHHLQNYDERLKVLKDLYDLTEEWWQVYMTNWALESSINYMKYLNCAIPNSENEFCSKDFEIKIWEHDRYYHSFSLQELEHLAEDSWYVVVENKEFENKKNIITILKKV